MIEGKLPPQDIEIEKAILGALLLEGKKIADVKTKLAPELFYEIRHGKIYQAMLDIHKDGGEIDLVTISTKLRGKKEIDIVGGLSYVADLTKNIASAGHLSYHVAILYQKWLQREMIRIGSSLAAESYEIEDVFELIKDKKNEIDKRLMDFLGISSTGISIGDAANKSVEDYYIREKALQSGQMHGIPSSFTKLNKLTGGFQGEQLIVMAGRPGMGKSSLAIAFMLSAAQYGKASAFFSLEMTAPRLTDKVICSMADIDHAQFKAGKLMDQEKPKLEKAVGDIEKYRVTFNENMLINIEQIHATCKMLKDRGDLDIVFIDYLQLMRTTDRTGNREQEISTLSRKAKMMAVDLNVPVVLLSQLNRSLEARVNKEPMLSDLRESGAIEQDADIVLFIYRDEVYNEGADPETGKIIIAKHREGGTGFLLFKHNKSMTKFSDFSDEEPESFDPDLFTESKRPF